MEHRWHLVYNNSHVSTCELTQIDHYSPNTINIQVVHTYSHTYSLQVCLFRTLLILEGSSVLMSKTYRISDEKSILVCIKNVWTETNYIMQK